MPPPEFEPTIPAGVSPKQRPLPDNTQHSQQKDIHAPGGIRTHNPSRRQPEAETSTWQHTTLTTERHPCPRRDSKPQPQQASARSRDLYVTTHNTHNRQTPMPPGGIRAHNPSRLAAADLRLRPRASGIGQGKSWYR